MNGCELPRADSELVEAVLILHELCNPIDIIVRQLHVDRAAVEVIINNQRLPKRQLHLAWPEPPEYGSLDELDDLEERPTQDS